MKRGVNTTAEKTILPFGDPVLRKKAKPVEEVNPRILKLLDDMVDTLYAAEGRAGLAAPQIGFLRRVIVMDCGDGLIELINPVMLDMSGEQVGPEGCLSFPMHSGFVKRANQVKISSLNRQGETFVLEAEGYLARCIQHEMDHLDGVLYIDRIEGNALIHDETGRKVNVFDIIRLSKPEH